MEFTSDLQGAFAFLPQERVIFGKGSVAQLATEIDRLGCQRAFVITGTTIATKTDLLRRVQEVLGPRFVGVFYPIAQHTPRPDVVARMLRTVPSGAVNDSLRQGVEVVISMSPRAGS